VLTVSVTTSFLVNGQLGTVATLAPVPAGSKLRGRVTVAEAEDVPPDGLRVNYHLVIEIEGGKKPACVAELIALHYR